MNAETERKRAVGIYYTPGYVVDYMVKHTLGRILEGQTPKEAGRLKILDPACGAGAFLLGAYQYLLDWHRQRYLDDGPERNARANRPRLCQGPEGDWRLTAAERQRILLNSIFGVDLDGEAVAAARESLLLKMLNHAAPKGAPHPETSEVCAAAVAPAEAARRLSLNLQCGNALTDVFAGRGRGFDLVLGNPPYHRELGAKPLLDAIAATRLGATYRSARMDLWYYFLHRGLELLRPGGMLSFIVSAYWTSGAGAERLVASLRGEAHLDELFLLGDLRVFPNVAGRHMIVCLSKRPSGRPTRVKRAPQDAAGMAEPLIAGAMPVMVYEKTAAQLFRGSRLDLEPPADGILEKLGRWPPLGEFGVVRQGIAENPASVNAKTNARFGNLWRVGEGVFALRGAELKALRLGREERTLLRPYYDLGDVARYWIAARPSLCLIYATKRTCPDIARYPRLKAHLERFRPIMAARRETRQGANAWWHLHWPREEAIWQSPKILCLQFAPRPALVAVSRPAYVPFSMNVFVPRAGTRESLDYLCGLLNSRLLWKWYQHHAKRRGVGLEINGRVLAATPIRRIDFGQAAERARHDHIASLARTMSELTCRRHAARAVPERKALDRRLAAVDRRLDRLVYALYGLTGEEITIVEDSTGRPGS
jgi:adenine-specific DNA-methyltransferase